MKSFETASWADEKEFATNVGQFKVRRLTSEVVSVLAQIEVQFPTARGKVTFRSIVKN